MMKPVLRIKTINRIIGVYAILGSMAFFIIQTGKLFFPTRAEVEMKELPFGFFDWGFVWSDTLIAGPLLLIGGIFLFLKKQRINRVGQLFAFTGFTINLYGILVFWIGMAASGKPVHGMLLWSNVILTFLGMLSMIFLAIQNSKTHQQEEEAHQD